MMNENKEKAYFVLAILAVMLLTFVPIYNIASISQYGKFVVFPILFITSAIMIYEIIKSS